MLREAQRWASLRVTRLAGTRTTCRGKRLCAVGGSWRTMATPMRPVPVPKARDSRLMADEPMAFEEFFDSERSRLFGALSVMAGNRFEAEEVMQDSFVRLWERWDHVSAMDDPVGFLYRTAMNLYRKRSRRAAMAMRKAANLLPQDDALAAVEARDRATRLLRTLTAREREALVLTAERVGARTGGRWRTRTSDRSLVRRVLYL